MAPQGIGEIAGLTVLGVGGTHIRGVSPSTFMVRLKPETTFDRITGDLVFTYGGTTFQLNDCATVEAVYRPKTNREGYRWDIPFEDRRWRWRYPRVDGEYNVRRCDGTIDPATKKSARELAALLFEELDDIGNVDVLSNNAFPYVYWRDAVAKLELQWLCDLFACVVCPRFDNTFKLEPITATASLPSGGVPVTPPDFSHKAAVLPSDVTVHGADKVFQDRVQLRSVAMDIDGSINLLGAQVGYSPSWLNEWWGAFPSVAPHLRHFPVATAHRWYQPVDPDVVLLEESAEAALNVLIDRTHCLPPQVNGIFWPLSDLPKNTTEEAIYAGNFRVRTDYNLVEFEYPVIKWDTGEIYPADLWITTAYKRRLPGGGFEKYAKSKQVPAATQATKPRILQHPELRYVDIMRAMYLSPTGDNALQLDSEAQEYLDAVVDSYDYLKAQHVHFNGLVKIELDGGVSQLQFDCGKQRPAFTQVGINTEFDVYTPHQQQRRALERLAQMAERQQL